MASGNWHSNDDHHDDEHEEEVECYCVRCRMQVIMLHPQPVYTRRGAPGLRGECDSCGETVFRMGKSSAHLKLQGPNMGRLRRAARYGQANGSTGSGEMLAFVNYCKEDIYLASRLGEDLARVGVRIWLDADSRPDDIAWARGVHPALEECSHMIAVLSVAAAQSQSFEASWSYFREQRKPIVVAQIASIEVPDGLRRSPRFDFASDYTLALREMVQALNRQR